MSFRDRNYLLDRNGNILKIVGDVHSDFVVGYVKYYPCTNGKKLFNGIRYATNTQVFRSYGLLANDIAAIRHVETYGNTITGCLQKNVVRVFDAQQKVSEVLSDKNKYRGHQKGEMLVDLLERLSGSVDLSRIGITGSFLTDMYDAESDIDLVCYGKETPTMLRKWFSNCSNMQPYEGDLFGELVKRRESHMPGIPHEILRVQEARKLQGVYCGVHVNVQPLREKGVSQPLGAASCVDIGDVAIVGRVTDDSEGPYAPAFYGIDTVSVVEGNIPQGSRPLLRHVISSVGAYSQILLKGEHFYAKGNLLRVAQDGAISYALAIDPWNRGLSNSIQLLQQ